MRILRSLQELDDVLRGVPEDAQAHVAEGVCMEHSGARADAPHSEEYRAAVLASHQEIAGRPPVRRRGATAQPAHAAAQAARHLLLPPAARVLVFGGGSAGMALALAQAGFGVTAAEADPHDCEAIRVQARRAGCAVEVLNEDLSYLERVSEPFDGAVFCGALREALDHEGLFRALDGAIRPRGSVLFAAEPIFPGFPIPWGVRLDGAALLAARKHGWLELGFDERYVIDALARAGWAVRKHDLGGGALAYEASRRRPWSYHFAGSAPDLRTSLGVKTRSTLRVSSEKTGFALFGPYVWLPAGKWIASLELRRLTGPRPTGLCTLDVCGSGQACAVRELHLDTLHDRPIEVPFELPAKALVEVRLHANGPVDFEIVQLQLSPAV